MGKTIDDILQELAKESWRKGNDNLFLSIDSNYGAALQPTKSELLKALKQAAPEKISIPGQQGKGKFGDGYNQAIDDYLANIHKLFKGEE